MVYYATDERATVLESCQENPTLARRSHLAKSAPPSKNRVWDFFTTSETCAGFFESQPVESHQEKWPTPTATASGVRYYGLRYYQPETGRWVSRDPIGEKGGRNEYCCCLNRCVDRHDVLGLFSSEACHQKAQSYADAYAQNFGSYANWTCHFSADSVSYDPGVWEGNVASCACVAYNLGPVQGEPSKCQYKVHVIKGINEGHRTTKCSWRVGYSCQCEDEWILGDIPDGGSPFSWEETETSAGQVNVDEWVVVVKACNDGNVCNTFCPGFYSF